MRVSSFLFSYFSQWFYYNFTTGFLLLFFIIIYMSLQLSYSASLKHSDFSDVSTDEVAPSSAFLKKQLLLMKFICTPQKHCHCCFTPHATLWRFVLSSCWLKTKSLTKKLKGSLSNVENRGTTILLSWTNRNYAYSTDMFSSDQRFVIGRRIYGKSSHSSRAWQGVSASSTI